MKKRLPIVPLGYARRAADHRSRLRHFLDAARIAADSITSRLSANSLTRGHNVQRASSGIGALSIESG